MLILKLIAGPLIGALIGYCTNYIAVKMLFKPHHAVMLGKRRLPFTPGLIPKRKNELAEAIGAAIGEVLLTKHDLAKALPGEEIKASITDSLWERFLKAQDSPVAIEEALAGYISKSRFERIQSGLEDMITKKILRGLEDMDISNLVVAEGSRAIREKVKGTVLAMVINDSIIQSVAEPVGKEVGQYIEENGEQKIRPLVAEELDSAAAASIGHLAQQIPLEKEQIAKTVDVLYASCVEGAIEEMLEKADIASIVEEKVRDMDVLKLEKLILSVMKKELNAIVNLGALIGLVIGLLNLLISVL